MADEAENTSEEVRTTSLPIARIKALMKEDRDLAMVAQDAVFLVARATELFVQYLAVKTGEITTASKRKTVQKKDIETLIVPHSNLEFLEGNFPPSEPQEPSK
eukprot:m.261069 g.261069  ORF g.261069 m.261069 type:complete len:103 (+) comp41191_c0_seq1:278-586(+)